MMIKKNAFPYLVLLTEFTIQQALSCLFPVLIFVTLALSKIISIPGLSRYDFILFLCLLIQAAFLLTKFETKEEFVLISIFHLIGLLLEIFKVRMGSWSYPEESIFRVMDVPLYSGFMYASVGSYIVHSWKRLQLRIASYPNPTLVGVFGLAIYLNFFTHHYVFDVRWILILLLPFVFFKTAVFFKLRSTTLSMPLVLAFFLIGFFIWIAENIATFFGAWVYPNQAVSWQLVHVAKINSWFLLVVISFILIALSKNQSIQFAKRKKVTTLS